MRRGARPSDESLSEFRRHSGPAPGRWHGACEIACTRDAPGRRERASCARPARCRTRDQERTHAISHDFPPPSACKAPPPRRSPRPLPGRAAFASRHRRRLRLCRLARRLRLQPGARRRRRRAEEDARRQGGRGGERPGDRRGREDHGVHDQSRRRDAALPDLVRLFQPAHAQARARNIPKVQFQHAGGLWTDKDPKNVGSYFGYIDEAQYVDGIVAGHSTKTSKLGFVAAKPIPQVLRNINSFMLGAQARQSERDRAGDLHRRLVDAGEGGGSHQQPGRRRRRRHHLPRRRPEDGDGDRRAPRRHDLRLSRQRRRRSRRRPISPAPSGTGRRSIRTSCRCTPRARPSRTSIAAA